MKSYNINKELKKKYIREFFGYMKNYSKGMSNNIHRSNWGKYPDFNNRRENILDTSPDKEQFYKHKLLTQKKGFKNYYSNENELNDMHLRGRKEYNIKYILPFLFFHKIYKVKKFSFIHGEFIKNNSLHKELFFQIFNQIIELMMNK